MTRVCVFFIPLLFIFSFTHPKDKKPTLPKNICKEKSLPHKTIKNNTKLIRTDKNNDVIASRSPFTANVNVGGPTATPDTLSFETNGNESMCIDGSGNVTIIGLANSGVIHTNSNGVLSTSLIVDADITPSTITNDKLANISSDTIANDIVVRDASGNFSANTITATLSGNASTATIATNFSGSLSGDITGTQSSTVVSSVGGQTATNIATATTLVNTATSTDTINKLVLRDGLGNFTANTITLDGNLALNESTSASIGNVTKAGNPFMHNYGTNNTFVGENAGNFIMIGSANSGFGMNALHANTTGFNNTAIGYQSLDLNTTGTNNSSFGYLALANNTSGYSNAASGSCALKNNTTGINNTAFGYQALQANTTGSSNIAIGPSAGNALTTGSNNISIGSVGVTAESNTIRIGTTGTQTACYVAGINGSTLLGSAVFVSSSGQLGTLVSSIRYKENVQNMHEKSSPILNLRPVTFTYKTDASHAEQFGLIAEEVHKIMPELVLYDADGQILSVKYHDLAVLLLNELIKQNAVILQLKEQITKNNTIANDRLTALETYA